MAFDSTKPATTDNYSTTFVPNIQGNVTAVARWLDSSNETITGTPPTFAKRYNRTSAIVQEWNGSAWGTLPMNIVGGAAGQIPYQTAANATAFLAAGTTSQVLIGGASAPAWTNTPSLVGTNFSGTATALTSGATNGLTATATAASYTWSGVQNFQGAGAVTAAGQSGTLCAYSISGAAAVMSFHRSSNYAINMGLDTDNVFRIGGWSDGAQSRWTVDGAGNFVARGDVTAFSDIRVKKDIEVIPDALAKVSALRGVTFMRTDHGNDGKRHAGVIAQEVEAVLPEAVRDGDDGIKTVAYGNMVGLLIEAVKELSARVAYLEARE